MLLTLLVKSTLQTKDKVPDLAAKPFLWRKLAFGPDVMLNTCLMKSLFETCEANVTL